MGMQVGGDHGELTNEPNLVPMIDVLLVLLVIFMLMVPMSRRIIELQLPSPEPALTPQTDNTQIVMEVLPGGQFKINTEPVSLEGLDRRLHEIYDLRPDKVLFVKGDPKAKYQEVITGMDVARGAGVKVIGIPPKESHASG